MIRADEANSIIEPYFDGGDSYTGHHKFSYIMNYDCDGDIKLSQNWDSGKIIVGAKGRGKLFRKIEKNDLSDYDSITLKMTCPQNVHVSVYFDNEAVLSVSGNDKMYLYKEKLGKSSVSYIMYEINNDNDYNAEVGLYYIGASKDIIVKSLYDGNWEGCIENNVSFTPFDKDYIDDVDVIRKKIQREQYKSIYENEKKTAIEAMGREPEQLIFKTLSRGFRTKMEFCGEMEALALVGMVEKNEAMIKMACRYALSMSACTYWCSDIMEEVPACVWHHRSFHETNACSSMAFVISLCGNTLTWHGRNVLYQALILKGLPRIEADLMTMDYIYKMNQGMAFINGYIKALICLSHQYPRYEKRIDEAEELFLEMLNNSQNSDGSMDEGAGYWQYTFLNAFFCIIPLAKKRGVSLKEYMGERLVKTSDFGLTMCDKSGKMLPISDGGKQFFIPIVSKCFYLLTGDKRWITAYQKSNICELGLTELLFDFEMPEDGRDIVREFEDFKDEGITSLNRNDIRIVCISGKSNSTHCHADKGSFLIYKGEKLIFIDRGACAYNSSGGNLLSSTPYHNAAVPVDDDGEMMNQLVGDGYRAKYSCSYENGIFEWISDQTALWSDNVKKNIRKIYSDIPNEFIITDEFEFEKPLSVAVNFHMASENDATIEKLSTENLSIKQTIDTFIADKSKVYRTALITDKGKYIKLITKIKIV